MKGRRKGDGGDAGRKETRGYIARCCRQLGPGEQLVRGREGSKERTQQGKPDFPTIKKNHFSLQSSVSLSLFSFSLLRSFLLLPFCYHCISVLLLLSVLHSTLASRLVRFVVPFTPQNSSEFYHATPKIVTDATGDLTHRSAKKS